MVLNHIVMWKFNSDSSTTPRQHAEWMKAHLEALPAVIPQCLSMQVGVNVNTGDAAYDAVLISKFRNPDDMAIYKNHPEHLKVREYCKAARRSRVVCDFWTEE